MSTKKPEITSCGRRVAALRKAINLSQQQLAEAIGKSRSYIGDIESGRSEPSFSLISALLIASPDVNYDWLITGRGEMFLGSSLGADSYARIAEDEPARYNVKNAIGRPASAGYEHLQKGSLPPGGRGLKFEGLDIVDSIAPSKEWLRSIGGTPGRVALIAISDDGMAPVIQKGDRVLIDLDDYAPKTPGFYIITCPHYLCAKRLIPRYDGGLDAISENPSFPPFTLDLSHTTILGRAIWYGRRLT